MKIKKILNNNTAVIDDNGNEVIVIGKGICFQRKAGDSINSALVEKQFFLSSNDLNLNLQKVLVSLPLSEINIVDRIIQNIRLSLTKKFSDMLYVSLCDHVHYALKNCADGISVRNDLLNEISHFYPDEYELGVQGIQIINEETGVELPIDEAGFIAMHIINSETENGIGTANVRKVTIIIDEILKIISNYFNVEIDEKSLVYFRLISHLKYFARNIVTHHEFGSDDKNEALLNMLKEAYKDAYLCAINIKQFIHVKYEVEIGNEELTYLIIHIQRSIS